MIPIGEYNTRVYFEFQTSIAFNYFPSQLEMKPDHLQLIIFKFFYFFLTTLHFVMNSNGKLIELTTTEILLFIPFHCNTIGRSLK